MKKVIAIMVLLVGFTTMAQRGENYKQRRSGIENMTPEQIAALRTKKMTLALDLSEAQQEQIQKLHLENAKFQKNQMQENRAKSKSRETGRLTSEERFALQNQRLDRQIAQKEKMKQILSEEQFEKWGNMKARQGKSRKRVPCKNQTP